MLFSIYDRVAMWFPFFMFKAMNEGEAMRTFQQILENPESAPARDPGNFILQCIGEFDQIEGKVIGLDINKHVATGTDFLRPKEGVEDEKISV